MPAGDAGNRGGGLKGTEGWRALSSPTPGSAGPKTARTEGPQPRGLDSEPADPSGSHSGLHGGNVGMQGAGESGDQGAGTWGTGSRVPATSTQLGTPPHAGTSAQETTEAASIF